MFFNKKHTRSAQIISIRKKIYYICALYMKLEIYILPKYIFLH